jgi:hypothetical protein
MAMGHRIGAAWSSATMMKTYCAWSNYSCNPIQQEVLPPARMGPCQMLMSRTLAIHYHCFYSSQSPSRRKFPAQAWSNTKNATEQSSQGPPRRQLHPSRVLCHAVLLSRGTAPTTTTASAVNHAKAWAMASATQVKRTYNWLRHPASRRSAHY